MSRGYHFLGEFVKKADIQTESLPGVPIVEIAATNRVLIENHFGVSAYSCERVGIKTSYGQVMVCGSGMEILRMTKEQLIISGNIHSVTLCRRDG